MDQNYGQDSMEQNYYGNNNAQKTNDKEKMIKKKYLYKKDETNKKEKTISKKEKTKSCMQEGFEIVNELNNILDAQNKQDSIYKIRNSKLWKSLSFENKKLFLSNTLNWVSLSKNKKQEIKVNIANYYLKECNLIKNGTTKN